MVVWFNGFLNFSHFFEGSMGRYNWLHRLLSALASMSVAREPLRYAALALCIAFVAIADAQAQETLTIRMIEPLPASIEPLYYRIAVGYPEALREGSFHFYVNGEEMPCEPIDPDSGVRENPRVFRVYIGAPGRKRVEAALKTDQSTLRQASEIDFRSKGGMALLGHFDGEALFSGTEDVYIFTYFMRDTRVRVNGRTIRVQSEPIDHMDGVFQLRFMPDLQPGKNLIEYAGTGNDGRPFLRSFSVFMVKDGRVMVGDRLNYAFGYRKMSEEDPEFRLKIIGTALAKDGALREVAIQGISESWLVEHNCFLQPIVARETGVSTIEIMAVYSTGFQNKNSMVITVEPSGAQTSTQRK